MARLLPSLSARVSPAGRRPAARLAFAATALASGAVLGIGLALLPSALDPVEAPPQAPRRAADLSLAMPAVPPVFAAPPPGRKFPPLAPPWLNGPGASTLAPVPGQVTVVDVWAEW
jgi:hypothetical protein